MKRLAGIQRNLELGPNPFLSNLNRHLQKDYEGILLQEECYWKQKSRDNWIALGDRNTSYFHASTTINKGRRWILSLQDHNEVWISNHDELKDMATAFYKMLYTAEGIYSPLYPIQSFTPLNQSTWDRLIQIPDKE